MSCFKLASTSFNFWCVKLSIATLESGGGATDGLLAERNRIYKMATPEAVGKKEGLGRMEG